MEQFNIYKNNTKVSTTDDTTFEFTDLQSDQEYTLGVSRVIDGRESEVVTIKAKTDAEVIEPPFNLTAEEVGDRYVDLTWDCDAPIGTAYFNIYVDDELIDSGFLGRRYTIGKLEPLTDYKICVAGTRDGEETQKVTINVSTTALIGDDEPAVPNADELNNLLHPIGDFEMLGEDGFPTGWGISGVIEPNFELTDEWVKHGEKSIKLITHREDMSPHLQHVMKLPKGNYIAIVDYKKPTSEKIDFNGELLNSHVAVFNFGSAFIQNGDVDEGMMYGLHRSLGDENVYVTVSARALNESGEPSDFYFDAVRVYEVTDELYQYIKKGNMDRTRIEEVFPYATNETTDEYDEMTVAEIKGLLDDRGIEYTTNMRKSELIELLKE